VLGVIPGIGLAIAIAIAEFLWDGWRPHSAILGRAHGVKGYHDITRYPDARRIPGLVLFLWDAPLFFANAEFFKERVLDAVANAQGDIPQLHWERLVALGYALRRLGVLGLTEAGITVAYWWSD
jgi:MFS superfamily sulfate permease-like transporter